MKHILQSQMNLGRKEIKNHKKQTKEGRDDKIERKREEGKIGLCQQDASSHRALKK